MVSRIQISKNFYLDEYIPKDLYLQYEKLGKLYVLEWAIDKELVEVDQYLRDKFGPTTINNWWDGGSRQWSGLRIPEGKHYNQFSQHSFGRASDKIYSDHTAKEVIAFCKRNYQALGIGGLEERATWVHTDVRNSEELILFTP